MALRRRHRRLDLNAEINVVSLIDVMLLLLVIFMIAAPMMQGGIDIALPRADAKPLTSKSGMTVSINAAREIFVDDTKFASVESFRAVFATLAKAKGREGVYLRADRGVEYGIVAQVLAIIRTAGVADVGLIAEPDQVP
jgi:biopolymer transport protein TolR